MNASRLRTGRRRALALVAFLALTALLAGVVGRTAADPIPEGADVVRVEEDWTLTVNEPNAVVASPQISTQMARAPYVVRFANFHLNSVDLPSFCIGGMQTQAWRGDTNLAVATSSDSRVMAEPNEPVTWTQYLRKENGFIYFGVSNGVSSTWGSFSGMEVNVIGSWPDLNDYTPNYSLQNSGVTYGANRVNSLVLVQVRTYLADGTVLTDATPRVVYSSVLDPQLGGDN